MKKSLKLNIETVKHLADADKKKVAGGYATGGRPPSLGCGYNQN